MDDQISRRAALTALLTSQTFQDVHDALEHLPAVDAVQVVRCRDCSFFNTEYLNHDGMCKCSGEFMENDDYCSLGERKDDNGDL